MSCFSISFRFGFSSHQRFTSAAHSRCPWLLELASVIAGIRFQSATPGPLTVHAGRIWAGRHQRNPPMAIHFMRGHPGCAAAGPVEFARCLNKDWVPVARSSGCNVDAIGDQMRLNEVTSMRERSETGARHRKTNGKTKLGGRRGLPGYR